MGNTQPYGSTHQTLPWQQGFGQNDKIYLWFCSFRSWRHGESLSLQKKQNKWIALRGKQWKEQKEWLWR